tara:strand:- start:98 stop:472 length:375 start_codon:yes stop_codon:yes gene_type:complete
MTIQEQQWDSLCRDSWNSLVRTPTNSLCVGDIITYGGLGGRLTNFYEVERFTDCYIIFKLYKTIGYGEPTIATLHLVGTQETMAPMYPYKRGVVGDPHQRMRIKKTSQASYLVNDKTKPLWAFN